MPPSETETPLKKLHSQLLSLKHNTELIPISEALHFESLLVAVDLGPKTLEKPKYVAQLYFIEDLLKVPGAEAPKTEPMATLQFTVNLPCQMALENTERLLVGLRLLFVCNQILPAGSLGINDKGELFYKYSLKAESQDIPLSVIVDELNLMAFFLPLFMPSIEAINSTEKSFQELSKDIEHKVGTLFSKGQEKEKE